MGEYQETEINFLAFTNPDTARFYNSKFSSKLVNNLGLNKQTFQENENRGRGSLGRQMQNDYARIFFWWIIANIRETSVGAQQTQSIILSRRSDFSITRSAEPDVTNIYR